MTGTEIIAEAQLYFNDSTELSSVEELDLLNKKYQFVNNNRQWEFLRKESTGLTTSTSVPYVALPADFKEFSQNKDGVSVIFLGTNYREYKLVSFDSRRQYRDQDGYCYVDMLNSRLYFTKQPTTAEAIEFDYIHRPAAIAIGTSPIWPTDFHKIISHLMAADEFIVEQSEKALSYRDENLGLAEDLMSQMAVWDATLKLAL